MSSNESNETGRTRTNADTTAGWFRVGLLSATILTPLIARWSRLRAAERAEAMRAQANSRWGNAVAWLTPRATASLQTSRAAWRLAQQQAQSRLPALGDRLGATANSAWNTTRSAWNTTALPASQRAWSQVNQQVNAQVGRAVPSVQRALNRVIPALPAASQETAQPAADASNRALDVATLAADALRRRKRLNSTLWLVGAGVGVVAAGTVAFVVLRRRMARLREEEPLVELPLTPLIPSESNTSNGAKSANGVGQSASQSASQPAAQMDIPVETPDEDVEDIDAIVVVVPPDETAAYDEVELQETLETPGVEDAAQAAFIGNIHTMIYHEADADDLPAEENRIYFGSEDEARAAGFHRDRNEVAPAASETTQG